MDCTGSINTANADYSVNFVPEKNAVAVKLASNNKHLNAFEAYICIYT